MYVATVDLGKSSPDQMIVGKITLGSSQESLSIKDLVLRSAAGRFGRVAVPVDERNPPTIVSGYSLTACGLGRYSDGHQIRYLITAPQTGDENQLLVLIHGVSSASRSGSEAGLVLCLAEASQYDEKPRRWRRPKFAWRSNSYLYLMPLGSTLSIWTDSGNFYLTWDEVELALWRDQLFCELSQAKRGALEGNAMAQRKLELWRDPEAGLAFARWRPPSMLTALRGGANLRLCQ